MSLLSLLLCYGLCFTIQHKLPFLHGKLDVLDSLLACTFCVGFHAGWMAYLLTFMGEGAPLNPMTLLSWGFASAAGCYIIDALVQRIEAG